MEKRLKIGLIFMMSAVILMPLAVLVNHTNPKITVIVLFVAMVLEVTGLIFVILNVLKRRKAQSSRP